MRKFDRQQIVADLAEAVPEMMRLAVLLTGREDVARNVIRFVLGRAVPAWATWEDDAARQAWFFHHTLLTTRRAQSLRPDPRDDTLLRGAGGDIEYAAFVRALRELPFQQAEAWLLAEALDLDLRRSATTMDLSTTATGNHLEAARKTLSRLAGDRYPALLDRVRVAARDYAPEGLAPLPEIRSAVSRYLWPRRVRRAVTILLLSAVAYALWRVLPQLLPGGL